MHVEDGSAAPLTEQPDQEAPPEPERWYELDGEAGELPWTGAAEAQTWAWEEPEESPFLTPELPEVQDTEATDVAAWREDQDEEAEAEDEETAAWPARTSAEAGRAGQRPGPGLVTVGVAELLQVWDTAAALDQRIRQMVRQTLLLQRGGLIEPAMAPAVPEWELDREESTPQLTFCQKARLAATAEDDVQARLIEQLKLPIRGDERAKIVQRVRDLVALFEGLDPDQKAKLRGRLNRPDDALARFFDCELSRGFRTRLRALLESPPSPVPPPPVPLQQRQPIHVKPTILAAAHADGAGGSGSGAAGGGSQTPPSRANVPVIARIFELVEASGLVNFSWKDRGPAPIGYLKGMALTYARVYCHYSLEPGEPENFRDRFAVKMAKGVAPGASTATDAVARYANKFMGFGADVKSDGVHVLRALFTILFGLGMRESGGRHCAGWDRSKTAGPNPIAPTATNSEAGLFQVSYDIGVNAGDFRDLYERYKQRPASGFLDVFSEGVTCTTADMQNIGAGVGKEFQQFSKDCPAFTVELAALGLRTRANHWGPINVNTVEIRRECWSLLLEVDIAIDNLGGCVAFG